MVYVQGIVARLHLGKGFVVANIQQASRRRGLRAIAPQFAARVACSNSQKHAGIMIHTSLAPIEQSIRHNPTTILTQYVHSPTEVRSYESPLATARRLASRKSGLRSVRRNTRGRMALVDLWTRL
jgi:hypothetical protein